MEINVTRVFNPGINTGDANTFNPEALRPHGIYRPFYKLARKADAADKEPLKIQAT